LYWRIGLEKKEIKYLIILLVFSILLIGFYFSFKNDTCKYFFKDINFIKQSLLKEINHFIKLKFKLVDTPINRERKIQSLRVQLIFRSTDDDRYYLFKAEEYYGEDYNPLKQIIAYRIFKYFDLETPPIFPMTLILTGQQIEGAKRIEGSVQEFKEWWQYLTKSDYFKLNQAQFNYLIKCEVLDLFLHNVRVKTSEIIIYKDKVREIDKIFPNRDEIFHSEFHSELLDLKYDDDPEDYQWSYRYLWNLFKEGKISLNPKVGLNLAKRIASTPDEVFIELLSDLPQKEIEKYLSIILKEKKDFDKKYLEYIRILHGFSYN